MKKLWNTVVGFLSAVTVLSAASLINVSAAEYTVTEASAVLYTNESTVVFADADDNSTVILPTVEADLPIKVTGVTSNGYFQIDLAGQTYYIQGAGLNVSDRESQVYNIIMSQKAKFPEGMRWTNENFYEWNGGIYVGGFGCAAFAFEVSDAAFGDAKAVIHKDYTNIKVGDMLRINNDTHSVIVLEVRQNSVIVAEGNYNSSIHWGRELTFDEIIDSESYIMTRYN